MTDIEALSRELMHELLLIQRKIDVSLVFTGIGIGSIIGLVLGVLL